MSAEIVRVELAPKTTAKGVISVTNDTAVNMRRESSTFNSFVNPGERLVIWEVESCGELKALKIGLPLPRAPSIFGVRTPYFLVAYKNACTI